MTDDQSEDPQRDTERLKAELARKEREIEELRRESSRTRKVEDDLWSHEIYLRARKKLAAGVFVVLGALSALGLVTVFQLYQRGLVYVDGELKTTIGNRIGEKADAMVEKAEKEMQKQISDHVRVLFAAKKVEFDAQVEKTEQDIKVKISEAEGAFQYRKDLMKVIDGLEAAKAKALTTKIENEFPSIIPFVAAQYPDDVRDKDPEGNMAKKLLRRLVILTAKEPEDRSKWVSAIGVLETSETREPLADGTTPEQIQRFITESRIGAGATSCEVVTENNQHLIVCQWLKF